LLALFLGVCFGSHCEATVYQSDGSAASVQGLHNAALNGDTIALPAGSFTWTTRVNLTKAITLQGDGVGATIIKDAIQSRTYLIIWDLPANLLSRVTGIQFQDGGRTSIAAAPGGLFHVNGSNINGSQFRMDHCKFDNLNGSIVFNTVIGVIDHTTFITNGGDDAICIYGERWNGAPPGSFGDASWAAPNDFGSSQFTFFEDCTFHNNNGTYAGVVTDCYEDGRFVVRHSSIHNTTLGTHGTESSGRERGSKAIEVYNNTFTGTKITSVIGNTRSAQLVYHDNTISGYAPGPYITLAALRYVYACAPWGQADGLNQWDTNSPTIYFTGTAAAPSSGTTVTVSGASWTRNQWAGYTIRRTSDLANSHTANASWIWSNTANTITYSDQVFGGPPGNMTFAAGDTLKLRKVVHALDEPGWTGGSLISGNPPVRPATWNDQVAAPSYQWNNGALTFTTSRGSQAAAFRDNTPMPGYTPYTYPHPLTTSLNRATLGNISTRGFVQTGDNVMIGGFIIQGTEPRRVIIRAIGPELTQHGVPNALVDPTLELRDGTGGLIASNYNWQTTHIGGIITANQVSAIRNSGYAPSQASESAIIATLPPGNYTAIVSGVNNTTGVALVDVYDLQ